MRISDWSSDVCSSDLRYRFALAQSDTGQARRAANFLLAWWNGDDWGHFPIADLFGVDDSVAADMTAVFRFLGQHPGAIYADAWGYRDQMIALVDRWRPAESGRQT